MASVNSVRVDGSTVSRADQALFALERSFNLTAGLTGFTVMLIAVVHIFGRKFREWAFDNRAWLETNDLWWLTDYLGPVPSFVGWMEQAVPMMAFLGLAYCQRLGGHIRMDILVAQFKGRWLYLAESIGVLAILVLMIALTWGSWLHFERSFDWNSPLYSRDSTGDTINIPTWPVKLLVPVMFGLMVLRLSIQLWAYGRAIVSGDPDPVAVPRIEDAAQQAKAEAETVSGAEGDR